MSLWIGTYGRNGGAGLRQLQLRDGRLCIGPPQEEIINASYGVWSSRHKLAYFVEEQDAGMITVWRRQSERWSPVSAAGSGGGAPCYLALDSAGRRLAVANYADGTVGLLKLDPSTGKILELSDTARVSGRGPDAQRQCGPHAHCALFGEDDAWLYHVDLGLDRILAYPVDGYRLGAPQLAFQAAPGSGPRHLVSHPDGQRALLICELSAELHLLERCGPKFSSIACEATSRAAGEGRNLGGHLALVGNGSLAVASSRGHDDLALFRVTHTGLERGPSLPAHGASPRHFWTNGEIAIVANEESGTVACLGLDKERDEHKVVKVPGACFVFHVPDAD